MPHLLQSALAARPGVQAAIIRRELRRLDPRLERAVSADLALRVRRGHDPGYALLDSVLTQLRRFGAPVQSVEQQALGVPIGPIISIVLSSIGVAGSVFGVVHGTQVERRRREEESEAREQQAGMDLLPNDIERAAIDAARNHASYTDARRELVTYLQAFRLGRTEPTEYEEETFKRIWERERALIEEEERLLAVQRQAEYEVRVLERAAEYEPTKRAQLEQAYATLAAAKRRASAAARSRALSRATRNPWIVGGGLAAVALLSYLFLR